MHGVCNRVLSAGKNKGRLCGDVHPNILCGECPRHLFSEKKRSKPAKKKQNEGAEKKKSKRKSRTPEGIPDSPPDEIPWEVCETNEDYFIDPESRMISKQDKKTIIGQYRYYEIGNEAFGFVSALSKTNLSRVKKFGLRVDRWGMHHEPPSIPGDANGSPCDHDARVDYWNKVIETKVQEADKYRQSLEFKKAFLLSQSFTKDCMYYHAPDQRLYFADYSRLIFNLTEFQYYLVKKGMTCGFFHEDGKKCESPCFSYHLFCALHNIDKTPQDFEKIKQWQNAQRSEFKKSKATG